MLVAALNRWVSPTSRKQWYEKTVNPRLLNVDSRLFINQRFWKDLMKAEEIAELQVRLANKLVETFETS